MLTIQYCSCFADDTFNSFYPEIRDAIYNCGLVINNNIQKIKTLTTIPHAITMQALIANFRAYQAIERSLSPSKADDFVNYRTNSYNYESYYYY